MFNFVKEILISSKIRTVCLGMLTVFVLSLLTIETEASIFHNGGLENIWELLSSAFLPDFSSVVLYTAVKGSIITLSYAMVGVSIALIFALILSLLASGIILPQNRICILISRFSRNLISAFRAIHELVWAWLFVASIGITPAAAILAIAIPYGGMIGKIWTDIFLDVPRSPIQSLKSSGASNLQLILYGYLPSAFPHMRNYSLYRLECAVRSSAILSFVGLRGLGYQIQLSLNDLQYREAWTYIYFMLIIVVLINLLSSSLSKDKCSLYKNISRFFLLSIFILSWVYSIFMEKLKIMALFSKTNFDFSIDFLQNLFGIGSSDTPAFLRLDSWIEIISLSFDTVKMSIIAIGITTILVLLTLIPSTNFFASTHGRKKTVTKFISASIKTVVRSVYTLSRAIPEIIWGMIIIFLLKPGILAGALALALHNFGVLGKLTSDSLDNMNLKPLDNLVSAGASKGQLLAYGVIPLMIRKLVSFILYRWEVIMRTTIVIGFIGAGGLGQRFKLSMSWFHYTDITLILICYILLVIFSDNISRKIRAFVA